MRDRTPHAESVLAQTFRVAMQICASQKADGVSYDERMAGLEKSIRSAWPLIREWKYLCHKCDDLGWVFQRCTEENPCGRPFHLPGSYSDDQTGRGRCTLGHSFCVPCWCSKGQAFRRHLEKSKAPVNPDTDYVNAGFSRVGR